MGLFVNLLPKTVGVISYGADTYVEEKHAAYISIPPDEGIFKDARLKLNEKGMPNSIYERPEDVYDENGVRCKNVFIRENIWKNLLPPKTAGVLFIVTECIAMLNADRDDLVFPYGIIKNHYDEHPSENIFIYRAVARALNNNALATLTYEPSISDQLEVQYSPPVLHMEIPDNPMDIQKPIINLCDDLPKEIPCDEQVVDPVNLNTSESVQDNVDLSTPPSAAANNAANNNNDESMNWMKNENIYSNI